MKPACALALPLLLLPANAQAECRLPDGGTARAVAAPDGRSLLLEDGREILLAGIEAAWPAAQPELLRRVTGRDLQLKALSGQPDRYGRLAAFVTVSGSDIPVQYDLIAGGFVRAAGAVQPPECRAELLARERRARDAGVGLWADPVYDILDANDPAAIEARRGRFAVIEGWVLSVRESGSTIYVNFGRRWSEDFTATIPKRLQARFTAEKLAPYSLSSRLVRVRGIVEERGGPWIELLRPDQIEFADVSRVRQ